jgi:DNA-binding NarL/FixJ family response regulator
MPSKARCGSGVIRTVVVDDSPTVLESIRRLLSVHPEIVVVGTASDGLEAVNLVEVVAPDLIIMDIQMPRLDGIQASRLIRERVPQLPILLVTSHGDELRNAALGISGCAVASKAALPAVLQSWLADLCP